MSTRIIGIVVILIGIVTVIYSCHYDFIAVRIIGLLTAGVGLSRI